MGHWQYIVQTAKNNEFFSSWPTLCFYMPHIRKMRKVEILLFKIGSKYKIYQPKAVVFMDYYTLFFNVAGTLTVNFLAFMVTALD